MWKIADDALRAEQLFFLQRLYEAISVEKVGKTTVYTMKRSDATRAFELLLTAITDLDRFR